MPLSSCMTTLINCHKYLDLVRPTFQLMQSNPFDILETSMGMIMYDLKARSTAFNF